MLALAGSRVVVVEDIKGESPLSTQTGKEVNALRLTTEQDQLLSSPLVFYKLEGEEERTISTIRADMKLIPMTGSDKDIHLVLRKICWHSAGPDSPLQRKVGNL
jgi:hypothetical protein